MSIRIKRAYEKPTTNDGYRVLVDRLWPRGISKKSLKLHEWAKEIAPSDTLRKSFHSGKLSWGEFRRNYLSQLKLHKKDLRKLAERASKKRVTLVFSSSNLDRNNAVVVQHYLKMLVVN